MTGTPVPFRSRSGSMTILPRIGIALLVALGFIGRAAIGAKPPPLEKYQSLDLFVGEIEKNRTVRFYMPTFTGRWACVPIFSSRLDIMGPDHGETLLGFVAVDTRGDEAPLQFHLPAELQPSLFGAWDLSILTPDRICFYAHNGSDQEPKGPVRFWTMNLSERSVTEFAVSIEEAEQICLRQMRVDPRSFADPGAVERARALTERPLDNPLSAASGFGQESFRGIALPGRTQEMRMVAPGSAPDRQLECRISPDQSFRISEIDRQSPTTPRWSFSQKDFETDVSKRRLTNHLFFPSLLTAPVTELFFVVERDDQSSTLFRVAQARKQRCWDLPEGYELYALHQSPNEEYAALRVYLREKFTITKLAHIAMRTSGVTVFDEPVGGEGFELNGVTDQGELLLQSDQTLGIHLGRMTADRKLKTRMLLPLNGRFAIEQ